MAIASPPAVPPPWELAAENIAVKIRWFGLLVGYILVNVDDRADANRAVLNAILSLGAVYTLLDTYYSLRGRVFLRRYPLGISLMEALFIGLLCFFHGGLESSFRFYYFLSLICCAIRYPSRLPYASCALHCLSYGLLYLALPPGQRRPLVLVMTLVLLVWFTWTTDAMSLWLKRVGEHLRRLNLALRDNQADLEARIAERTRELQEAQAHVLHQEKMAAIGLFCAGIAHEVGNPLTSISSLVQMLQRRDQDQYSQDKLALVSDQLRRIQGTLRELVTFSRPASKERTRVALGEILEEALNIAKYYKRTKQRALVLEVPPDLPLLHGVRDQLVQVFLNLVLNAVDATEKGGRIELRAERCDDSTRARSASKGAAEALACAAGSGHGDGMVQVTVRDDGGGIAAENAARLFQPYFTTKRHGTGLGLFVTRKLVADHGGSVEFSSQPGAGTTFCVRLPVAVEPEPEEKSPACLELSSPRAS
jgi:two-component system NtrC family sensor kinase